MSNAGGERKKIGADLVRLIRPYQLTPQRRDYLGATIRLRQEYAAGRQIVVFDPHMSRRRNDLDRRPAVSNEPGKLQTVHRAWHLDIGEDDVNIGSGCEDCDGFVGIAAWMTSRPAFSITSAESIRNNNSSSTIKITGLKHAIQFNPPLLPSGPWKFCYVGLTT